MRLLSCWSRHGSSSLRAAALWNLKGALKQAVHLSLPQVPRAVLLSLPQVLRPMAKGGVPINVIVVRAFGIETKCGLIKKTLPWTGKVVFWLFAKNATRQEGVTSAPSGNGRKDASTAGPCVCLSALDITKLECVT